ncbi:MAG TPA: SpoIIE family protein phosphatase, partial [Tenuifilaceae bacterium]|nr:SpoIIE family protein phosphatase [Tenuifilaceae bacterium]
FMDDYTNHEIELHEGDRIYLFTDGFADQFGGPDYRKFMAKSLRALIADTFNAPIAQQGSQMEQVLNEWIASAGDRAEQIDDITLMGIEI